MKRTFNYTGRQRIDRNDAALILSLSDGMWSYDASLSLADYKFPKNAEVWVEAYRQNLWMKWQWGTISATHAPADRRLTEFENPEGLKFRIRVVQPLGSEHHKLLGEADGIPFVKAGEVDDRRQRLLVTVPDALDQQLWKINFDADPPTLLVNQDAKPSWKSMAASSQFEALVYPEVFRSLLIRILIQDEWTEENDIDWQANWMKFALNLRGMDPVPNPDSKEERELWIEETVSAFCRKRQLQSSWNLIFDEDKRS
jgi:hypothetical protein